ncbi:hypothetical protein GCM10028799_61690 [Kribbella italica]
MGLQVERAAAVRGRLDGDQALAEQCGGEGEREQRAGEAAHEGILFVGGGDGCDASGRRGTRRLPKVTNKRLTGNRQASITHRAQWIRAQPRRAA